MSAPARDSKRLLIIDDDDSLRELFEITLEQEGFLVAGAADGERGLAKARAYRPHLIVLDLMMPNLNGFEVLHRLQKDGMADIPVIVITGYSEDASGQIIRQEPNVVEFIQKPLRFSELTKIINRLLRG